MLVPDFLVDRSGYTCIIIIVIIIKYWIYEKIHTKVLLYINKIKLKLCFELIKITWITYNIQSNTFTFLSYKPGASRSYPYAMLKRHVFRSDMNTSRDEHSLNNLRFEHISREAAKWHKHVNVI